MSEPGLLVAEVVKNVANLSDIGARFIGDVLGVAPSNAIALLTAAEQGAVLFREAKPEEVVEFFPATRGAWTINELRGNLGRIGEGLLRDRGLALFAASGTLPEGVKCPDDWALGEEAERRNSNRNALIAKQYAAMSAIRAYSQTQLEAEIAANDAKNAALKRKLAEASNISTLLTGPELDRLIQDFRTDLAQLAEANGDAAAIGEVRGKLEAAKAQRVNMTALETRNATRAILDPLIAEVDKVTDARGGVLRDLVAEATKAFTALEYETVRKFAAQIRQALTPGPKMVTLGRNGERRELPQYE